MAVVVAQRPKRENILIDSQGRIIARTPGGGVSREGVSRLREEGADAHHASDARMDEAAIEAGERAAAITRGTKTEALPPEPVNTPQGATQPAPTVTTPNTLVALLEQSMLIQAKILEQVKNDQAKYAKLEQVAKALKEL